MPAPCRPIAVLSAGGISSLAVYLPHTEYCHVLFFLISKFVYQHIKRKLKGTTVKGFPPGFFPGKRNDTNEIFSKRVRVIDKKSALGLSGHNIVISPVKNNTQFYAKWYSLKP